MRKALIALVALLLVGMLTAAGNGAQNYKADLTGDSEVPPVATATSGHAIFHVNQPATEIDFKLKVKDASGLLGVAGAHIHCAPAGSNGPVVAFLATPVAGGLDGKVEVRGTLTDADIINPACGANVAELAASMAAGATYVNVHSIANPSGEVRGQIG